MLAGLLLGIVHDRRLMREAKVILAIRWFIGYGLHEKLPDHSSLTRIRQRWGEARFRRIFKRTVAACFEAKIATAEIVHIDASLIRANVSWESLVERHVADVISENRTPEEVDAEIEEMASDSGDSADQVRALFEDPDRRESLRRVLVNRKTLKHISEVASNPPAKAPRKRATTKKKAASAAEQEQSEEPEAEPAS